MWTPEQTEFLNKLKHDSILHLLAQTMATNFYNSLHQLFTWPSIIISAGLGTSLFAIPIPSDVLRYVGGSLATTSAVLLALHKHLDIQAKILVHTHTVKDYEDMIEIIRFKLRIDIPTSDTARVHILRTIREKMDTIIHNRVSVPSFVETAFHRKYNKSLESQLYDDLEEEARKRAERISARMSRYSRASRPTLLTTMASIEVPREVHEEAPSSSTPFHSTRESFAALP